MCVFPHHYKEQGRMKRTVMSKKIFRRFAEGYKITRRSFKHFGSNRPMELAGTTAYFAIFSMVPVIIIIVAVFGYFAGDEAIRQKLFEELNVLLGQENTRILSNAINNYQISEKSGIGTILGVLFFLFSATTLFSILQRSLNFIWRVKSNANFKISLLNLLKTRILSFGVILGLGFVLLVSLIVDAIIALFQDFLTSQFSPDFVGLTQAVNFVFSLAVVSTVIAIIYKFLPDVKVKWSASWFGAIYTALLFAVGRILIGLVIGSTNLGEVYGAASSLVIILMWVYFASLIFYFGVELTHQFSRLYNHDNKPANYAVFFEIEQV
mgnify:CR=1 FL=1